MPINACIKLLGLVLLTPVASLAAGPVGVLVVPDSKVALQLTVALPENVKLDPGATWRLAEEGAQSGAGIQLLRAIAPDGTEGREHRRLVAIIQGREGSSAERRFRVEAAPAAAAGSSPAFEFRDVNDTSLGLWEGQQPVLVYNHGVITCPYVPEKDNRRSRACYVHPVWGLSGEVITDDFSRDHYHHHGICWTWPHIRIEDKEYDLWADRGIKQRFVRWLDRQAGSLAAVLGVENGWFVDDRKVMIERVWLQAYQSDGNARALDIHLVFIPVDRPITLWGAPGKSYGGLMMRFAPRSRQDTVITVPSGRTTEDLPDTHLTWADFTSRFGQMATQSGGAVFVDPGHPDYPPTWLTRHYGPLCVGWPGVNPKTFEPGKPIRLDYRIWIHKTALEPAEIQQAYDGYCAGRKARWE